MNFKPLRSSVNVTLARRLTEIPAVVIGADGAVWQDDAGIRSR